MAPTGGEKDIIPPIPVRTNPENLSIHFKAQKITITFNEFIQTGDFGSQAFFSPALNIKPLYRVHGKTLTITLNDTLKSQTTYTINFGTAVKDITEGNIMVNYQYVFSTGDYIDSMSIQGVVKGAEDGLVKENVMAMLYNDLTDSIVAKERPAYYAHTDKDGHFEISHLKEGTYQLIGLRDLDADLLLGPGEEVAFVDTAVQINDSTGFYTLQMFKPIAESQKILGTHSSQPGKLTIAFAKQLEQLKVIPLSGNARDGVLQFNAARDTAIFFLNDVASDSIQLQVVDGSFTDTAEVRMKKVNEKEKVLLPKFTVASVLKSGRSSQQQEPDKPFLLQFSTPVIFVSENKELLLTDDSTKTSVTTKVELKADTGTLRKNGSFIFPFTEKTSYTLLIPDSVFKDVYGRFNDSTTIRFTTFEKSATGNLLLKVTTDSIKNYFYELRNSSKEVIARGKLKHGLNELNFQAMRPGNYSLKVIDDLNANNRWDTGNYWKHLQPEKIYNYTDDITLRPNWDLDVEMKVGVGNKLTGRR
ncbi:MAG: Ig-like domain-containing domain [Chitinophagales bacterium]